MKRLPALFVFAITCIVTGFSCIHGNHDGNVNFNVSESDHSYAMNACFSKNKTRDVGEYMDSRIGRRSTLSFANSRIDATLTLDDHTTFYIKKYPGSIEIKLDKDENSGDSYREIKAMCEGIKKILTK